MPKKLTKSVRAQLRSFAMAHGWTMGHAYAFLSLDTIYGPNPFNMFGNQIKTAPDVEWTDLPIKCGLGCSGCAKQFEKQMHPKITLTPSQSLTADFNKIKMVNYAPDPISTKVKADLLVQMKKAKESAENFAEHFQSPPPADLDSYCVVVPKGGQLLIQATEECVVTVPHSKVRYIEF